MKHTINEKFSYLKILIYYSKETKIKKNGNKLKEVAAKEVVKSMYTLFTTRAYEIQKWDFPEKNRKRNRRTE